MVYHSKILESSVYKKINPSQNNIKSFFFFLFQCNVKAVCFYFLSSFPPICIPKAFCPNCHLSNVTLEACEFLTGI